MFSSFNAFYSPSWGARGDAVVRGNALQAEKCHWNFSFTGVDSASKRNEYQGYFLGG